MKPYLHFLVFLTLAGSICFSCEGQDLPDQETSSEDWIQQLEARNGKGKVKRDYIIGAIENTYAGHSGQGAAVLDGVLYRLYNTGLCQTYDMTDPANPEKIASFKLGSHQSSNHSNCAQFYVEENGDTLLYVSGLKNGKAYVERISPTWASLVQVITIPQMEILENTNTLNVVCGDDGFLWLFGPSGAGDKLIFAKAHRPLLSQRDALLSEDDILEVWKEDGYVYSQDVSQGGMVYNGLLFFLFGATGSRAHLAVYDTQTHRKISDIKLSGIFPEEPEDCELLPQGIMIVTNRGNYYYIVQPY